MVKYGINFRALAAREKWQVQDIIKEKFLLALGRTNSGLFEANDQAHIVLIETTSPIAACRVVVFTLRIRLYTCACGLCGGRCRFGWLGRLAILGKGRLR